MKKVMLMLPLLAGISWGSAGIFVRTLSDFGFDNYTMVFIRTMVSSVILFAGMMIYDRSMLKIKPKDIPLLIMCGFFGMVGLNFFYNQAIEQLTLSLAAVLLGTSPIFVMILAAAILKERITSKKILCTIMAIFGCVLVSGALEVGAGMKLSAAGALSGVGAAVCYAVYSILSKMAMKKGYSAFAITFYSLFTASMILVPVTNWDVIGRFETADPLKNTVFILMNALCVSILPNLLYTLALSHVDAGKVSILASGGEPAAAMVFGIFVFSEIPTVLSTCGLIITIAALWLLCRPDGDMRKADEMKNLE